ncbi:MAG: hypothetical protein QOI98_1915 [Solirubrobacteraceae bacterium]|nr:hypothetical protein [Solirubrobacteraceae bacterium]
MEAGGGLSRRVLLERAGLLGLATALAPLPDVLARKGLLGQALAAESDVTKDTLSALVAFILPGNDDYSRAQGDRTKEPGGIAAGTVPKFIDALDRFVPVSVFGNDGQTLPASGGVATLLNSYALQVNPGAANGAFLSPFARLSNKEKAMVFERLESDPEFDGTELKFVGGILPGFVGFMSWSEAGVLDPRTRRVKKRPVGWRLSKYGGPSEGHAELKGYYQGRKRVRGSRP